ncbi:alpha-methylacyl-CoA racemase [Glaciecola punicea ACAM 611]|jgi:alpha-methylacyl-CoA racemase|uniref:Alpha-methylacyl-CoA racemase n=1 Tax=Glaciecola punicea ACAM 611 TaxID=1121923 RepID=H5TDT7_9ALTE|nr:CaiB/BaiF CoA-transferase family protein [Glaciecola punicea]OFA29792.1 carnitine dehydratase [Glaciecola punicea]GAB56464.1 alpha-methylacyl-CoA racemase [Glaciecola punicea ACAM 611]
MGALDGIKVIEMSGLGPCPFAGMLLADMGAEVIKVERSTHRDPLYEKDISARGKKSVVLNLKTAEGREVLMRLIQSADVLIEGYRPGVAERLGFGPTQCEAINDRLIYGRMTGWGQVGPLAGCAGHDLNYIAVSGALHAIGKSGESPTIPLNIVGDFAGGSLFLTNGILAALFERTRSNLGQVVDAAMVDGVANLMWMYHSFSDVNQWNVSERGTNLLDGGAFFYDTFETFDCRHIALASIEPQFFKELIELAELDVTLFNTTSQYDRKQWPILRQALAKIFKQKTQQQWCAILEGTDACFAPVLTLKEAPLHPHNVARETYLNVEGQVQPAPAPRLSRTPSRVRHGKHEAGVDTYDLLAKLGYSAEAIRQLKMNGAVG